MTTRPNRRLINQWHTVINDVAETTKPWPGFMYTAKNIADELPRLALLFDMERNGNLAKVHHQCSHDTTGTPVHDNHLTCALGVECRACPFLLALDRIDAKPEEIDEIKAWTCITHILSEQSPDRFIDTSEGYILTTDDRMYWDRLYSSWANMANDDEGDDTEVQP